MHCHTIGKTSIFTQILGDQVTTAELLKHQDHSCLLPLKTMYHKAEVIWVTSLLGQQVMDLMMMIIQTLMGMLTAVTPLR